MLKLFIKDNTNGCVREYGTDQHDALVLQNDGSLHYENLQSSCGTMFADEGYSFCLEDGNIPGRDEDVPYIDIGGVDAVPVVRCKDCKYRGVDGECPMYHEECIEWVDDEYAECEYVPQDNTHDDGFCDCGAKMDGDENVG